MTILFLIFLILVDGILSVLLPYLAQQNFGYSKSFSGLPGDGPGEFPCK
jgi:hypothetical protein